MHRSVRRLTALAGAFAAAVACSEYPVESCPPGQGVTLYDDGAPRLGPADARVELELFGDFQCPGTRDLWFRLVPFLERLEGDGRADAFQIRFHHFPLAAIHPRAQAASLAAAAAHRQGDAAFWAIFPLLLRPSSADLSDEDLAGYAEAAGLDPERFAADFGSDAVAQTVAGDLELALALGLPGTPAVLLCGIEVDADPGALVENLEYLIY